MQALSSPQMSTPHPITQLKTQPGHRYPGSHSPRCGRPSQEGQGQRGAENRVSVDNAQLLGGGTTGMEGRPRGQTMVLTSVSGICRLLNLERPYRSSRTDAEAWPPCTGAESNLRVWVEIGKNSFIALPDKGGHSELVP